MKDRMRGRQGVDGKGGWEWKIEMERWNTLKTINIS